MLPSLLVKDALYFICEHGMKILGYGIGSHELWEIDPPFGGQNYEGGILMTEDGGLGFACMEACGLVLWSLYVGDDGIEEWEQFRIIELDMLITVGDPLNSLDLVGFLEDTQTIFMSSDVGVFAIELKPEVKKVSESRPYYAVIPHMSFYTSDLARAGWHNQLECSDPSRLIHYAAGTLQS